MAFVSLKTKMSLAVSLLVIALVGALAYSLFAYFKRETKKTLPSISSFWLRKLPVI